MSDYTIEQIMRAIAKCERNSVGDHWSTHWCKNAANEIERLRAQRDELATALQQCESLLAELEAGGAENPELEVARAALAKLEGKQ